MMLFTIVTFLAMFGATLYNVWKIIDRFEQENKELDAQLAALESIGE